MLRLLQLNLALANDKIEPGELRLPRVIDAIEREQVNVCLIQAASPATIHVLAGERHVLTQDEMAIIAAPPINDVAVHALTRREDTSGQDDNDRAVLSVRMDDLTIFNAHLSWVEAQAVDNVAELLAHADAVGGDVLIVGDLNQEPASPAMRALEKAGFVDCWARLRHGEVGFTYEVGKPSMRIDYIWERAARKRVTSIALIGDIGEPLSDHFGLVAEIDG